MSSIGSHIANPPSAADYRLGLNGGRLLRQTSNALQLLQHVANVVEVRGHYTPIPASPGLILDLTDTASQIDLNGANVAALVAVSTTYYVYVSNAVASYRPQQLAFSTQVPSKVDGVRYLQSAGEGLNWRCLGMFRTDSAGNLQDTVTQRLVLNFDNRILTYGLLRPAYNNNNAATIYSLNSTTWARMNGGTGDAFEFLSNGEDAYSAHLAVTAEAGTDPAEFGIGESSATQPSASAFLNSTYWGSVACSRVAIFVSPGLCTLYMLGRSGADAAQIYADTDRNGAAADPAATMLSVLVWL